MLRYIEDVVSINNSELRAKLYTGMAEVRLFKGRI